jgi:MFS superfamily sulfate permease-like transporter
VLIGYMNGIALLMIVRQLGNLTGGPVEGGDQSLISCRRW